MKKRLRIGAMVLGVVLAMGCLAACSNGEATPSGSPVPTATVAPVMVVTPAPTPVTTPSAETEASASAESAGGDASASSSTSSGSSNGVLKREMRGEDVTEVQERLRALGYLDKVTGYFGTDTEAAVKKFQENNGLTADGMIGPKSMEVLMSESAKQA